MTELFHIFIFKKNKLPSLSQQDDLRKEDFSTMSAPLLFKMIKSKTDFPLHKAIKVEREDVVFLYLIEMDSQVRELHMLSSEK